MKTITYVFLSSILATFLVGCETMTKADLDRMTPAQRDAYYQQKTSQEMQNNIMAAYAGGYLLALNQPRQPSYPYHTSSCYQAGTLYNCTYY